jgi:hypothetical protein
MNVAPLGATTLANGDAATLPPRSTRLLQHPDFGDQLNETETVLWLYGPGALGTHLGRPPVTVIEVRKCAAQPSRQKSRQRIASHFFLLNKRRAPAFGRGVEAGL